LAFKRAAGSGKALQCGDPLEYLEIIKIVIFVSHGWEHHVYGERDHSIREANIEYWWDNIFCLKRDGVCERGHLMRKKLLEGHSEMRK